MASEAIPGKLCFVTTGATAPFTGLIESVLKPSSLDVLSECGFTHVFVQFGSAKDIFEASAATARAYLKQNEKHLVVDGMDFDSNGLIGQFTLVQETRGLVISHAGSGTILAALRFQIPLVVVPNRALLDNHQEELAVAMEEANYLIRGDVENLAPAIKASEEFRDRMTQFPPITSGEHRHTKSFANVMDETMGFTDFNTE
ncbi:N-acetylglucosaminyldiphosphodolichol N-acetylglucosaminyltransferase catalytic subunit alg13 [Kalmusia sp. IMI 367209]|nr:N-acetylglucosaminyldiphosphodolichol N-acetylglucosaminyltransferase catalytic subunit alg13 [Kalmusia sp. IMI 367209]